MRKQGGQGGALCVFAIGMASVAAGAPPMAPSVAVVDFDVRLESPVMEDTVREALRGAFDRLGGGRCRTVFSEFRDTAGRPLQEELDHLGQTGQDRLRVVLFRDGMRHRRCGQSGIMAVTSPGSPIVYVCPEAFWKGFRHNPLHAEATLIHEALHTLGLGEDPPPSREITARVIRRCRR